MIGGRNLLQFSDRELREIHGKQISAVLQSPATALNPALSIGAQLNEAWKAHAPGGGSGQSRAIAEGLVSVGLPSDKEFLRRRPAQLSVGQGQRVCIAMAVMHRAQAVERSQRRVVFTLDDAD